MSLSMEKQQGRYASLGDHELEEQDLGHESDTTACSEGFLGKKAGGEKRMMSRAKRAQMALVWVRWGTVIGLQLLIVMLLFWRIPNATDEMGSGGFENVETGGDINGLFKTSSHKITPFTPEPDIYMPNMSNPDEAHRLAVREKWDKLMPRGSGSVEIKNWEKYPLLGPPVSDDPARNGSLYEATWTHALHCLYYHVDTYHQLLIHINNPNPSHNTSFINPHHASHCFEYLRNNILCSADMTLEGGSSAIGHEGLGQNHVCRNREEAIRWIEERRVDDVQSIVGS